MAYDTLPGRSRENAIKALEMAEKRGFDSSEVLTTRDGYLIPGADESNDTPSEETKTAKPARKRTSTKE